MNTEVESTRLVGATPPPPPPPPPPPQLTDAAMANARHIARFAARPYPRPLPSGNASATRAFEAGAFPKLVAQLREAGDASVRARAAAAARDLLVSPLEHVQFVAAGVTPALVALAEGDASAAVRRDAARALEVLARRELGARDALQHGALPALFKLLAVVTHGGGGGGGGGGGDGVESSECADAAYAALSALCAHECGRAALAKDGAMLAALLSRAQAEEEEQPPRAVSALELLRAAVESRFGRDAALGQLVHGAGAVPALSALLLLGDDAAAASRRPPMVLAAAARLMGALCLGRAEAITEAVKCGCMRPLLSMLGGEGSSSMPSSSPSPQESDAADGAAAAAAEALLEVCRAKEGKEAFLQCDGPAILAGILQRRSQGAGAPILLDAHLLQIVAHAAELPACREKLVECGVAQAVSAIAEQCGRGEGGRGGVRGGVADSDGADSAVPIVQRAAAAALQLMSFKHWPL